MDTKSICSLRPQNLYKPMQIQKNLKLLVPTHLQNLTNTKDSIASPTTPYKTLQILNVWRLRPQNLYKILQIQRIIEPPHPSSNLTNTKANPYKTLTIQKNLQLQAPQPLHNHTNARDFEASGPNPNKTLQIHWILEPTKPNKHKGFYSLPPWTLITPYRYKTFYCLRPQNLYKILQIQRILEHPNLTNTKYFEASDQPTLTKPYKCK